MGLADNSKVMRLNEPERELLVRCIGFVFAGEWPWEPEKAGEQEKLRRLLSKLSAPADGSHQKKT